MSSICVPFLAGIRRRIRVATIATGYFAALAAYLPVSANETMTDTSAVESGREALRETARFPWYDEDRDTIRRLEVHPPRDTSARKSRWEYRATNWSWPEWLNYLLEAFGWLLLALAIIAVIYFLLKAFGLAEFAMPRERSEDQDALHGDIDRVEALPFQLQRPQSDLLAEARRHYELGDYGQAMIYLYSYELIQLDRHHRIRLTKGKTNRQYLRELRLQPDLWNLLRASMIAFEDVFFGHHQLDRARFEECWKRLDEFHELLEPVAV